MRIPTRRGEKLKHQIEEDHFLTPAAILRFKKELERLLKTERKEAIAEVQRLAEMGDFSENVGYQVAKATLRRINNRILILEDKLKRAVPILSGPDSEGRIRVGSTVVLEKDDKRFTYEILGSQETNPSRGRISYLSPLGAVLIGKKVEETAIFINGAQEVIYKIIEVK